MMSSARLSSTVSLAMLLALVACNMQKQEPQADRDAVASNLIEQVKSAPDATSTATTLARYKADLARRIVQVNSLQVHAERPQALLRAVIVIRYVVDQDGQLIRSVVVRSNHDKAAEATALASLRNTAPFPKPSRALLGKPPGRVELAETWLFNDDGRFQLRTIAQPQQEQ
jgi:protein TonB